MSDKRIDLVPGFTCHYPFIPTYVLHSIYPMGDVPLTIFQEMARHIPGIKTVESCGNRYELHVVHNCSDSSKQIATMTLFAEEVRRYFEPIKVGHPVVNESYSCRQPVPGFTVALFPAGNSQTKRPDVIEQVDIHCPTRTTYIGDDRLKAIAATVPGVDRIYAGGLGGPNRLAVHIAEFYRNDPWLVIGMLLTQLRRVFPTPGNLPTHSPLHHEPLTIDDLQIGTTITRHRRGHRDIETATVSNIVTDDHGVIVIVLDETRHVVAADYGLCPYVENGKPTRWSEDHYTLLGSTPNTTN